VRAPEPLVIDGRAPVLLPAFPLRGPARDGRALAVWTRTVYLRGPDGWNRIPRGYVTDWGSIPRLAELLSLTELQPFGSHAMAAGGHDWRYAIGEPGRRKAADDFFHAQMVLDGVPALRREIMYAAVRLGGAGGYAQAERWWRTENFADPVTGAYPVAPPFRREDAFEGRAWGLRDRPDWIEP